MQPIMPPLSIYKHADTEAFKNLLSYDKFLTFPPSFNALEEILGIYGVDYTKEIDGATIEKIDDSEAVKILNLTTKTNKTHPIWWAILYQCYLSAKLVGYLHSIELGSMDNIYVIETSGNHFYYSVGHPIDPTSVLYDGQEAVYEYYGIESKMSNIDYTIAEVTKLKDFD